MWDLVPWPGIEPRPPTLGAQSLSHWSPREVPRFFIVHFFMLCFYVLYRIRHPFSFHRHRNALKRKIALHVSSFTCQMLILSMLTRTVHFQLAFINLVIFITSGHQDRTFPHSRILIAAAAAASRQSCATLCDPIDGSPPGSSVPGILQERVLEWAAISFCRILIIWIFLCWMFSFILLILLSIYYMPDSVLGRELPDINLCHGFPFLVEMDNVTGINQHLLFPF